MSNHVARLEEHFDMPLFYRSPALTLTPAGELVLAFANAVGREEANLKDMLSDMKQEDSGVIRFGGSAVRINSLLPHILPQFSARYPKVDVEFRTQSSVKGLSAVLDGAQDFAMTVAYEKTAISSRTTSPPIRSISASPTGCCANTTATRRTPSSASRSTARRSPTLQGCRSAWRTICSATA